MEGQDCLSVWVGRVNFPALGSHQSLYHVPNPHLTPSKNKTNKTEQLHPKEHRKVRNGWIDHIGLDSLKMRLCPESGLQG